MGREATFGVNVRAFHRGAVPYGASGIAVGGARKSNNPRRCMQFHARPGSLHEEVEEIPIPCLPSPAHSFPHLLRSGEQESGLWSPTVRPMSRGTSLASRRQPAPRHAERGGTSCSIHAACMQHPCNIHATSMQHPCNGTCGHGGGYREYRARPPKSTFHSAVRCEGRACSGAGWGRAGSRAASCWVEWGVLRHIQ